MVGCERKSVSGMSRYWNGQILGPDNRGNRGGIWIPDETIRNAQFLFVGATSGVDGSGNLALPTMLEGDVCYIIYGSDNVEEPADAVSGWTKTQSGASAGTFRKTMGATPDTSWAAGTTNCQAAAAAFRGITNAAYGSSGATGIFSNPNPPQIATAWAGNATNLVVICGRLDDDIVTFTAPADYTLAATDNYGTSGNGASVCIAYRLNVTSDTENPGSFLSTGVDNWFASTEQAI